MTFFKAYSAGTYEAYKAFRMPAGVAFELQTNKFGSLASVLTTEPGGVFGQPKALERWRQDVRGKGVDWDSKPVDEQFLAYVSPVTSKPASRGRIKTSHSEVLYSYHAS
jgi:hypothetical protein